MGLMECAAKTRAWRWPARDLYTPTLFTKSRAWEEKACDQWLPGQAANR